MIIKYCPECIGFPYTKNMSMDTCPTCGSDLETEIVSKESFLKKREKLGEYKDIYDLSDNTSTVDTDDYQFGDGNQIKTTMTTLICQHLLRHQTWLYIKQTE